MELHTPEAADRVLIREPEVSVGPAAPGGRPAVPEPGDLAERIDRAREEERLALSRELHDDIGGTLTALKLRLVGIQKRSAPSRFTAEVQEMAALVDTALAATERLIRALRPGILDQGVVAALQWETAEFTRRSGLQCRFTCSRAAIDMPKAQSLALYRICQEALTNVAKHAAARSVEVHLFRDTDAITLEITDDGRGFDPAAIEGGRFGVVGMRERAKAYGGWVDINSAVSRGTTVMVSMPLRRVEDVQP